MKKKVFIIVLIILILLVSSAIGVFYLFHPKDESISLADENIIDISASNTNVNEVEQKPDIVPTETEVEVKEENINKEDATIEKTVSQTATTQTTSSKSAASTKNNTKTKATTSSSNVKNTKSTEQSTTKNVEKAETPSAPQTPTRCTNNSNHGMNVGNSGQWFASKSDAIAYYNNKINYWDNYWNEHPDESDKYYANCPYGHEEWSCMYCDKWTINLYYR